MKRQPKTKRLTKIETVEESILEARRLMDWLGYVAEHEYTASEQKRLITSLARFARIAQPIANKYID